MNAQQYLDKYQNQSLLWAANKAREYLRGQCVQGVCFFVAENGKPVIWADAYQWWSGGLFPEHYDRIPNSADAVPQPGDIIVWGPNTPGSGGAGHIAVCLQPRPGTGTFVSVDQNWGGKTIHTVIHNYNNVVGWLRIKGQAPAPAPAPSAPAQTQGDEMIANADQAIKAYKMLRPNGQPSQDEINGTAGRRTFAGFLNDAQGEINQRDANLRNQAEQLANMSNTINAQNAAITDLNAKLNDANLSNAQKQAALDEAITKMATTNAELTTCHDQIKDLQDVLPTANPEPAKVDQSGTEPEQKPSLLTKLILAILKLKKK